MAFITETEELTAYLPSFAASFEYKQMKPFIEQVELEFVKKIMGATFYNSMMVRYDADTLTPAEVLLLPYIQRAETNMAALYYIPMGNIMAQNGGLVVPSGQNFAPASQYRVEELKDSVRMLAHKAFESLIDYLVENHAAFPDYTASTAKAEALELFINSASDFSLYFNIQNNRWVYWNIRAILTRMEEDKIKPRLSVALFDEIKAQIVSNTVSANNLKLIPFIKGALAKYTISEAIVEMGLMIDDKGLTIYTSGTTNTHSVNLRNPAPQSNMTMLMQKCLREAEQKLKELEDFLNENHADYPIYEASTSYKPTISADITNKEGQGYYRV